MKILQLVKMRGAILFIACLLACNLSYAAPPTINLDALTKGCLDPAKPEALAQCQKLCNQGYQFYCDAIKGNVADESPLPGEIGMGSCNVPDSQLPKIEGFGPEDYAGNISEQARAAGATTIANMLEYRCTEGQHLNSCKVLCKIGCSQYCNYCAIGAKGPSNPKLERTKYFHGTYAFLEQSFQSGDEELGDGRKRIIHNCNPATKKRGVGLIPGGDEGYIGLGYGHFGWCKGYCNENLMMTYAPLARAFKGGDLGSAEEYDGIPTDLELIWAGGNMSMYHPLFKKWGKPAGWKPQPPRDLKAECLGGKRNACSDLCKLGAGNEQYCVMAQELSDKMYCERYGGPGVYQNVSSCQKLCATGKPEYQKYCGENQDSKRRTVRP